MSDAIGTVQHHRARKASAIRHGNAEAAQEAGRDLRAAVLAGAIKRAVREQPPLTAEQRVALAGMLVGGDR
jgi:hypothetical protein